MEAGVAEVGITGTGLPEPQQRRLFLGFNRPDGRWLLSDLRAIASQRMWVPGSTGGDRPHPLLFNLGPAFILICASSGCFITESGGRKLSGAPLSPPGHRSPVSAWWRSGPGGATLVPAARRWGVEWRGILGQDRTGVKPGPRGGPGREPVHRSAQAGLKPTKRVK